MRWNGRSRPEIDAVPTHPAYPSLTAMRYKNSLVLVMPTIGRCQAVVATWVLILTATSSPGATNEASDAARFYHVRRAVFRCPKANRGLAFDGRHFWVGEFGGWVRCYDRTGRPVPSGDLGDGTVRYLGHGVAAGGTFIVAGARDFIAILPRDGGPMRRIETPVKGRVCAVAFAGTTLWAMNYQSPVLYEMDLQGRLLRKFTTAQRASSSSNTISMDCDGHLYVIQGWQHDSRTVFEYSPDGALLRTHTLAVPATSVALDPNDRAKTLYAVSFPGDTTVYEYRLAPGRPEETPVPKLARSPRYRPDGCEIAIENGPHRFNRPLYGSNTAFYVHAGDKPEFMLSLPGKGGTLQFGIASREASKWLSSAKRIRTWYRGGSMRYEIHDGLLGDGSLHIDVVPMGRSEGMVLRVRMSGDVPAVELVWAFGGASGFNQLNLDTSGYCPEAHCLLKPDDCRDNRFELTDTGFELRAPCYASRFVAGTVPKGSPARIADAGALGSPKTLLASKGGERPILAGRQALRGGDDLFWVLQVLPEGAARVGPAEPSSIFQAAEQHRKLTAERVRIRTPDAHMNASVPAICSATDGLWDPPTYSHGGVRWHLPFLGWRSAYVASEFGWHDRAQTHFRAFAKVQLKEPADGEPRPDPAYALARQASDSVLYTRGYIPVHPEKDARGPYDMQQVYIDQLLWHFLWTGDVDFVREMWPVLVDHLDWEKRCFDPDGDGLFENYANTLISDAHHYSGGACTQASAYNYRAFSLAARLAALIGKDPEPYRREAEKTRAAMNRALWMPELGWFAEYRDLLGLKRLHPSAELPTVYHPIDSDVPDMFQAWQLTRYVETAIEHVPVDGDAALLWSSNWVPYIWSIRNILASEVAHTALAYWQAGRRDAAYDLWRGAIVDSMYCSRAPGACLGTSEHDGHWTGVATDFSCSVAMFARGLVEGLFGIVPDALDGELLIRPGLPRDWPTASIDAPEVGYTYTREGYAESFRVRASFKRPMRLRLRVAARATRVADVTVNGQKAAYTCVPSVGEPVIEILAPNADGPDVRIRWEGDPPVRLQHPSVVGRGETMTVSVAPARLGEVFDPQSALTDVRQDASSFRATVTGRPGHRTLFARVEQGDLSWWAPIAFEVRPPIEICDTKVDRQQNEVRLALRNNTQTKIVGPARIDCGEERRSLDLDVAPLSRSDALNLPAKGLLPGTNPVVVDLGGGRSVRGVVVDWRSPDDGSDRAFECVDLTSTFNDRVTRIFEHEYRTPRSPYCSLQMPLHGFGDWCYGGKKKAPVIDDDALRQSAGQAGRFVAPQGIPFATPGPGDGHNVVFTSQWDNFPQAEVVPLTGKARHVWFLVAGSTHPMHSQLDNGELVVSYADGTTDRLALHNPTTWWPIEADYDVNVDGYCIPGPRPPRIDLGSGKATVLDLPLDPDRTLRSLTVRCLANEVVVGLLSATLLR